MSSDVLRSAITAAVAACLVIAIECAVALPQVVPDGPRVVVAFLGINAAVAVFAALAVVVAVVVAGISCRIAMVAIWGRERARSWPGLFGPRNDEPPWFGAAQLHGVAVASAVFLVTMTLTTSWLITHFREPTLIALLAATFGLAWVGLSAVVGFSVAALLRGRHLLGPARAGSDPLRSASAAGAVWIAIVLGSAAIACDRWEALRIVFPWRWLLSLVLLALLLLNGRQIARRVCRESGRPRRPVVVVLVALAASAIVAAVWVDSPAARRAVLRSPTLGALFDSIRSATDLDGDGYGSLFGEGDCAPLRSDIHPGAVDVPNDGVDQNCAGGDFVPGPRPSPFPDTALPAALARDDWSILLVTIDTLRYDHVGFGGYARPTTPDLDQLAARGLWFRSFYSSGCWTKDALPALVTSQFVEELPLGEVVGSGGQFAPRRIEPEAVTLAEVLHGAGYRTAMFMALEYYDGWGIDQGFETHVNLSWALPYATAPALTDRALEWLGSVPEGQRWFLWLHYFEPHWPYEAHDGSPAFGTSHPDRYDGEIRFVDAQLGRLAAWLEEHPEQRGRTIVAVTADHGEAMKERGSIGHGAGVWDYLIHIPLTLVVPGVEPRKVSTPTSMIDLAPTLVALAGVAPDPSWNGHAHVADVALGRDDPDRVVFAANYTGPTFAAVTEGWKLTFDQRRNLYQLVDRERDPREERDASARNPKIRRRLLDALRDWRERTVAREFVP